MQSRRLRIFFKFLLAVIASSYSVFAQQSARIAPADILILRAKNLYAEPGNAVGPGGSYRHGKIVAVGSNEMVEKMRGIARK